MHSNGQCTKKSNIGAGIAAGMIGGAVGAWTMERFQSAWSKVAARLAPKQNQQLEQVSDTDIGGGEEPATVRMAEMFSQRLFHHELTERQKQFAGPAVHYGFGTTMGGLYGALAAVAPKTTKVAGLPFGTALWLTADEAALPALGLSAPPTQYPAATHVYALASHLVYGLTTEMVRRALSRRW